MQEETKQCVIALIMGLLGFGGWWYLIICLQNMGV